MAKEIERKFLIDKSIPWELGQQKLIKQGYILLEEDKHLRIRVVDNKGILGLKYLGEQVRDEYEYEIPLIDGLEILNKCELKVEKIRNTVSPIDNSYVVDIDTYPNGLIVAEVEFKSVEDANKFVPIDWFGEEITGNREYSNITLAGLNLRF
jgi:CYTH domain-containing protein